MVVENFAVSLKLRRSVVASQVQRTDAKDLLMTSTDPTRSRHETRRLRFAAALATATLLSTSCGLAFGDEGDDISAEVAVAGRGGTATTTAPLGEAERSEATVVDQATTSAPQAESAGASTPAQIDERFNGRSTQYLGIDVALGDLIFTGQTATEYLRSEPAADGNRRLLVEVAVTNNSNGPIGLPRTVLGIRLASGERLVAEEMLNAAGESIDTARTEAQATERVILTFPDADLTGASFEITEASTVPQFIPLDLAIPVPETYSLELPAQPAVSNLSSPSLWPACEYAWTGEVVGAAVLVEGLDGVRVQRAIKGSRWVVVDVLVSNDTTESEDFYPCNQAAMPMTNISPRLRIDGVATSETNRVPIGENIEMDAMAVVQFWYRIDVDTESIELTDTSGTRIAAWELDLPAVPGEA